MRSQDEFLFMWDRALEALLAAERGTRRVFRLLGSQRESCSWEPPMDVFEYPERIRITMGLPGVEPDSIRVSADRARSAGHGAAIARARVRGPRVPPRNSTRPLPA